ncbi:MAG: Cof-type HAD-IIB family hydrolase [Floccifex sp.]
MNYKLVAIDMDGTLLQSNKTLSKGVIEAIQNEKDMEIVICTGRCLKECYDVFEHLDTIRYLITTNGALVYDIKEKKTIYERSMSVSLVHKIFEACHKQDIMMHILDYDCFLEKEKVEHTSVYGMEVYQSMYKAISTLVDNLEETYQKMEKPIQKINLYHRNKKERQATIDFLKEEDMTLTLAENSALECTAKSVDKGIGLEKLCEFLQIKKEQCVSIGDNHNDLATFQKAGLSIAMGNSSDEIKKQAHLVVSDNDHDGVKEALECIRNKRDFV